MAVVPGGFEGWNGPWCAIVGTDTITNTRQMSMFDEIRQS